MNVDEILAKIDLAIAEAEKACDQHDLALAALEDVRNLILQGKIKISDAIFIKNPEIAKVFQ